MRACSSTLHELSGKKLMPTEYKHSCEGKIPGSEGGYYTFLMSCLAKTSAPKIE